MRVHVGAPRQVFDGVDVNKLCSRFPALLLQDPRVTQERVRAFTTLNGGWELILPHQLTVMAFHIHSMGLHTSRSIRACISPSQVETIRGLLDRVAVRTLATRAAHLLLIESEVGGGGQEQGSGGR